MSTIRQVKQAMQPLLQRNPDLELVGRFVVIKPVHHILRGIHIDRSLVQWLLVPTWTVNFLFGPSAPFDRIWGASVYPSRKGLWLGDDPTMYGALCDQIERDVLPLLRQVQTIDDFATFNSKERFRGQEIEGFPHLKLYVDIARGDFDAALKTSEVMKNTGRYSRSVPNVFDEITKTLHPMLVANDRAGLARILREWEQGQVKGRKLEKFWEPTPFPFESQTVARS
jgi:hypothetical protein